MSALFIVAYIWWKRCVLVFSTRLKIKQNIDLGPGMMYI